MPLAVYMANELDFDINYKFLFPSYHGNVTLGNRYVESRLKKLQTSNIPKQGAYDSYHNKFNYYFKTRFKRQLSR